jgi:2-aminoadipate transaminase
LLQNTKNIKLIYVISDFQNPTGRIWNCDRRKQLAELAAKYGVIIIEDNPYGELRF